MLSAIRVLCLSGVRVVGHQGPVPLLCPFSVCVSVWDSLDYSHPVLLTVISLWVVHVKPKPTRRISQRVSILLRSLRVVLGTPESPSVTPPLFWEREPPVALNHEL